VKFSVNFWLISIAALLFVEFALRLRLNSLLVKSKDRQESVSQELLKIDFSNIDPNISQADLRILATEYNEHVKFCVAQYGNWASAIKSKDSKHMPDFQGRFLNVVDGLRATVNQPSAVEQQLFIFGGSTVFCGEVSDQYTLCSQTQYEINLNNFATKVVNFGRHGSTLQNRLIYLKRCQPRKGDLVLIWFGVNELGWKLLEGKTNLHWFPNIFYRFSQGLKFLSKLSAFFTLISQCYELYILQRFFEIYAFLETKKNLVELDKLSNVQGFKYKVILQPSLLTKLVRSPREDAMYDFFMSKEKGKITKRLFDGNYPRFRHILREFNGHDGSGIFDQSNREVFADWVHLNSEGNRLVASFIYAIFESDHSFAHLEQ